MTIVLFILFWFLLFRLLLKVSHIAFQDEIHPQNGCFILQFPGILKLNFEVFEISEIELPSFFKLAGRNGVLTYSWLDGLFCCHFRLEVEYVTWQSHIFRKWKCWINAHMWATIFAIAKISRSLNLVAPNPWECSFPKKNVKIMELLSTELSYSLP